MPKQVEECVESVLEDHPEYSESRAYAICNAQHDGEVEDAEALQEAAAALAKDGDFERLEAVTQALDAADGVGGGSTSDDATAPAPRQKAMAETGFDVIGAGGGPLAPDVGQKQSNEMDIDDLPPEYREAVEADDFIVYGKASIEQYDVEDQRITMAALTDALDRFFESEDAPGIISRGHTDVPVGTPVREHTLDADTTLVIDGERYEFEEGDVLRTEAKDADDDGLPELWLVTRLANDSELARETRLRALQGDLNGYSVTVYPREAERTQDGEDVTKLDLHAVTIGTDEQIKNKGSEFDVAEFKGLRELPQALAHAAADMLQGHSTMKGERTLGQLILRKSGDDDADEQPDGTDEASKAEADEGDAGESESLASPILAAVEDDDLTAEQASTLNGVAEKMHPEALQKVVDAIAEDDLDVDQAVELLNAMDYDDGAGGDGGDDGAQSGDMEDDQDDEEDDAEQKASARKVAEDMADRFDIPVDEVMEHLENLEMDGEKDDPGELKAEAVEPIIDDKVTAKLDAALDERLPDDDLLTADELETKLSDALDEFDLDDEVVTKSEFEDLIQNADVTTSPVPTAGANEDSQTLADAFGMEGGD